MGRIASILCFLFASLVSFAQDTARVHGQITTIDNKPIGGVHVSLEGTTSGTWSDEHGKYEIMVPSGNQVTIVFSHISFGRLTEQIAVSGKKDVKLDKQLKIHSNVLPVLEFEQIRKRESEMMTSIDPKPAATLPSPNPSIEALIKVVGIGVSSTNELSSQYNVRGGNFDENLVYVNGIQVYRPFLVRSGQQEGMSFVNPDMVSGILFSAGGFEAKYGDKMSSVLDIKYTQPTEFAGTVSASLLGGSVHLENATKNERFTYVVGARYKTNQYVLKSLDTDGSYKPFFADFQGFITYRINPKLKWEGLTNWSRNTYRVVPQSRTTEFGTVKQALQLRVFFDGQEIDAFDTYFGATTLNFEPDPITNIRLIGSAFRTFESETFDVMGQYYLDELETDFGKDDFGNVAFNRGVGTFLNHARNYLDATVLNGTINATRKQDFTDYQFEFTASKEMINDQLSEWNLIDSAGFSLPQAPGNAIILQDVVKAKLALEATRFAGYAQVHWQLNDSTETEITAGLRTHYWDVNEQLLISPRASISFKPKWKREVILRAASGFYYQPPFYRELRSIEGKLNKKIRAQQSIHFIAGGDYFFKAWNRNFKLVSEVYFKKLNNLIPYEVDNVRIRYFATNNARGYATGIDFKLNGEFVEGVDSWFNLSVMQVREDLNDDFYIDTAGVRQEPGFIPRPSDQRVNLGIYFQDYLPKNPTYKVHLSLLFGTGLPFGPPTQKRYQQTYRMPPYRRVDIGFSKQLADEEGQADRRGLFRQFKSLWLSMEVFNLLQVNNVISYLWVKDVTNEQYAVPNYLTSRQLNIRITGKF
ncbi:MAG: carboxypeptidase-like regulatory domain-containing protein [Flavobacteriales bacterium]|nr:carboxypeptidase-like regulatory domain-containing protein [Flavobacteriales bacterium]